MFRSPKHFVLYANNAYQLLHHFLQSKLNIKRIIPFFAFERNQCTF